MCRYRLILLLFVACIGLWSQTLQPDSLITGYSHGLNTDDWYGGLSIDRVVAPQRYLSIGERLSSSRIRVAHDQDKWKDQHHLYALLTDTLSRFWTVQAVGSQFILQDHQSGFENDITTQMIGAGATYTNPYYRFRVPVLMGYKQDARLKQKDQGWTSSLGFQMPRLYAHEYTHQVFAKYDQDDLNRRKNRDLNISYQVHRQFANNTTDTLNINYADLRRDYYISPAGEVESRQEQMSEAENRLTYGLSPNMQLHVLGRIGLRELNIRLLENGAATPKRKRRDLETTGAVMLTWFNRFMDGRLEYRARTEEQQYEIAQNLPSSPWSGSSLLLTPDNQSSFSTLALITRSRLGSSDSLYFNVRYQKFKYDTPDESNYDDRDEVRYNVDLTHKHQFNRELIFETDLAVHLHHLIYIYGQKSADNNWTRMVRLKPAVTWKPNPGFRLKQSAEVLANYVDYDFDSDLPGIRSFIYRKFQMEDSCSIRLLPGATLHTFYRLEMDENGKLIWDDWLQQRLIDRRSHTLQLLLEYTLWERWTILPGYSIYKRRGYQYASSLEGGVEKKLNLDFQSQGPILKFTYAGRKLNLSLSSHTIRTKTLHASKQIYTRLDFAMRWYL